MEETTCTNCFPDEIREEIDAIEMEKEADSYKIHKRLLYVKKILFSPSKQRNATKIV